MEIFFFQPFVILKKQKRPILFKLFYASLFIITYSLFTTTTLFAQGHKIEVKIKGLKDTTCYLTYYYENQRIRQDSGKADKLGRVIFQGKEALPSGLYSVVIGKSKIFDIIINDQAFGVETNYQDPTSGMLIFGSRDNQLFYALQQNLRQIPDSHRVAMKQRFIQQNPNMFSAKLIAATIETPIPTDLKDEEINRFFINHFLDNIDFTEDGLVRSPFVHEPLKYYFDQLNFVPTDSLKKLVDMVLARSKNAKIMRKYCIARVANYFESSPVMGHDAIYAYILEKYYVAEPQWWGEETVVNVQERLKTLKPLLLGNTIPNLVGIDANNKPVNLYSQKNKKIVMMMYATDCGHCQLFMPEMTEYAKKHKEVGIFAVVFGQEEKAWKKFIATFGMQSFVNVMDKTGKIDLATDFDAKFTPMIYILDENKKIIGKGTLGIESIERILARND